MATLPDTDFVAPQIAGEILLLPVADIEIGQRLRDIDTVWASALGAVMGREGQQTPIEVCRLPGRSTWDLVAGAHRLTGAKLAGIAYIEAREVSSNADFRKLREASENIWRRGLDPLSRAAHVAELVRLHKVRAGIDPNQSAASVAANARWQKAVDVEADDATATIAIAYGWTEEVAAEIGLSARTVRDDLALYRRIGAGLVDRLRRERHPILANAAQLKSLAKLEADEQRDVVAVLTGADGWEPCGKVADALGRLRPSKPAPDAEAKRLSAFIGAFTRMSISERKAALDQLAPLLPAGVTLGRGEAPAPAKVDLHEIISFIDDMLLDEREPDWLVCEVASRFGGTARYVNGTCELRVGGVVGTCTSGGRGQLASWQRAARKRLLGLERVA